MASTSQFGNLSFKRGAAPKSDITFDDKIPVKSARELLKHETLTKARNKLFTLIEIDCLYKDFNKHCLESIHGLAEFVQLMPVTKHGHFAGQYGWLQHSLDKAALALKDAKRHFIREDDMNNPISELQAKWLFVVLSASLFHKLGDLPFDINVTLYNTFGKAWEKPWQPFSGSMLEQGAKYYQYEFSNQILPNTLRNKATMLLAKQLIPEAFKWIASDPAILAVWLDLLMENWQDVGSLSGLIPQAQFVSIYEHFRTLEEQKSAKKSMNYALIKAKDSKQLSNALAALNLEAVHAFLQWLQQAINEKKITVNSKEASVLLLKEGAFLTTEAKGLKMADGESAFEKFAKETNEKYGNSEAILRKLEQSGVLANSETTNSLCEIKIQENNLQERSTQDTSKQNQKVLKGILIENVKLVSTDPNMNQKLTQGFNYQIVKHLDPNVKIEQAREAVQEIMTQPAPTSTTTPTS